MQISSTMQRMILDTFLKGHREDILEMVNNAVELVHGFDERFKSLEQSIEFLVSKQKDNDLKGELLDVLEDLKDGVSLDDALDADDETTLPAENETDIEAVDNGK